MNDLNMNVANDGEGQDSRRTGENRKKRLRVVVMTCLGLVLAEAVAIGFVYAQERISLQIHARDVALQRDLTDGRFAFFAPGIDRPPTRSARDSQVADEERIIGIDIGGKYRAYRITAMYDKHNHVINDLIDDHPVSVTYCNLSDCAVGFEGGQSGELLKISQGGLFSGGMVICVDGAEYAQQTLKPLKASTSPDHPSTFPYQAIPLVRTTWKDWRDRHPETDIYEEAPEVTR